MLSVQYHNYIIHTQRYTASIKMHQTDSLIPRPPLFTSVCVQYDTWKGKSGEKFFSIHWLYTEIENASTMSWSAHTGEDCSCTLTVLCWIQCTLYSKCNYIIHTHTHTQRYTTSIKMHQHMDGQEPVYQQQPSLTVAHRIHKHCKREYVTWLKCFRKKLSVKG